MAASAIAGCCTIGRLPLEGVFCWQPASVLPNASYAIQAWFGETGRAICRGVGWPMTSYRCSVTNVPFLASAAELRPKRSCATPWTSLLAFSHHLQTSNRILSGSNMTAIAPGSSFRVMFMARADGTGTRLQEGDGYDAGVLFTSGGKGQGLEFRALQLANTERPVFDGLLQRSSAFARLHSGGYGAACKVLAIIICAGGAAGSCVRCACRRDVS